jgi:hypothetical protein
VVLSYRDHGNYDIVQISYLLPLQEYMYMSEHSAKFITLEEVAGFHSYGDGLCPFGEHETSIKMLSVCQCKHI